MATILGIKEEMFRGANVSSMRCATIYAVAGITEWNDAHSGFATRAVTEIALVGITILGVLESLALSVYALIVKGASVFVSNKDRFEELIVTPAKLRAATSFLCTNIAAVSLIENLKSAKLDEKAFDKVMDFYRKA